MARYNLVMTAEAFYDFPKRFVTIACIDRGQLVSRFRSGFAWWITHAEVKDYSTKWKIELKLSVKLLGDEHETYLMPDDRVYVLVNLNTVSAEIVTKEAEIEELRKILISCSTGEE